MEAGNKTDGLKEYNEDGMGSIMVGTPSADILRLWWQDLLHLRCQREIWVVCKWTGGE